MKTATRYLAALLLVCFAGTAMADIYPPGPGGAYPDTLDVTNIQNPAAVPHPVSPDSVRGIGGIVTAFDTFGSYAMYMQLSPGGPWTGIDVFTSSTNYAGLGFSLGDSIVVYGQVAEFNGGTEITADDGSFGTDLIVRQVSTGNALPPFHDGTVAELNQLPINPNAEQWEGGLVRVADQTRVVRTNFTGGSFTFRWMRLVDNTICPEGSGGPCDTLLVDMSTLANPAISPPAVGAIVNNVQGIFEQRTDYHIQIRDGNDLDLATPPNLANAYIIDDNKIKVVYDRDVTQASAENVANYSLASFSLISSATQISPGTVELDYTDILPPVNLETLTVNGIVSSSSGLPMTTPQNASFWNKVNDVKTLQDPDPAFLSATPPCEDRSRFAGPGSSGGDLVTWRGVGTTGNLDALWYIADQGGGPRSGISVYSPQAPIQRDRKYLVVARVQEFFGETEAFQTVEVIDEGPASVVPPITLEGGSPLTVFTVTDTTCDATQTMLTGEDYEGTIVTLSYIRAYIGSPFPGAFFNASGGPLPTDVDTINVDNDGNHVFQADTAEVITVTGVIRYSFGSNVITPRDDADFLSHGVGVVSVGDPAPVKLAFSIYPNPARTQTLVFSLPFDNDVKLEAFDLAGRRVATLVQGRFPAGSHSVKWDGRDSGGNLLGAGVYFYKLKIGSEVLTQRAVLVD